MKDCNVFFLTNPDGQVPLEDGHGLGFYYHDCRFLNGYELQLDGIKPNVLISTAARGFMAIFELTSAADLRLADGSDIRKEEIGITWERVIDDAQLTLHDRITLRNFGLQRIEFPLSLTFRAGFEDIYAVPGFLSKQPGTLQPPAWQVGSGSSGQSCRTLLIMLRSTGCRSGVPTLTCASSASPMAALQPTCSRLTESWM